VCGSVLAELDRLIDREPTGGVDYPVSMVNVTVSLPDDVASRVAAAAADRG
jgi:hypothetical protein